MLSITLRTIAAACIAAFATAPALAAQADPAANYPTKPIRFIVPFSPGAGTDTTARTIAQKLGEKWGQQVVVDNRTGAGGAIGVDFTAKANPDGYTICLISASNSVNSATNPSLPYDLEKELQGVSQATSLFYVLYIHPSLPAKTVKDLIAHTKANPGKLNFGTSGTGTLQHFAGELFNHQAGISIVHVPYKGTAQSVNDTVAGHSQLLTESPGPLLGHIKEGKLVALGSTGPRRSLALPNVPTFVELGYKDVRLDGWIGLVVPAGTPAPIVAKISEACKVALATPEIQALSQAQGFDIDYADPKEFRAFISSELQKWGELVKMAGVKAE